MASKNPTVTSRIESLQKERNELLTAKQMAESQVFQNFFAEKIYKKNKKLKSGFNCKTWDEYNYTRGLHDGYQAFFACIDEIETQLKFIDSDLEKLL